MLPIYIFCFAGQDTENKKNKALANATGFVLDITVFLLINL